MSDGCFDREPEPEPWDYKPCVFALRREAWEALSEAEQELLRHPMGFADPTQAVVWEVRTRWALSSELLRGDARWIALAALMPRFGILVSRVDCAPACRVCGTQIGTRRHDKWADKTQTICRDCAPKPSSASTEGGADA